MVWPRLINFCTDGVSNHAWTSDESRYYCRECGYVYPDAVPIPDEIKKRRRRHSRRNIVLLLKRDGRQCFYCWVKFTEKLKPTVEHRVPRFKGGTSVLSNLVAACSPCNNEKGYMDEEEYLELIKNRPKKGPKPPRLT